MIDWLCLDSIWSLFFLVFLIIVVRAGVQYYEQLVLVTGGGGCPTEETNPCGGAGGDEESEEGNEEESEGGGGCGGGLSPIANSAEEEGVFLQMCNSDLRSLAYHLQRLKDFQIEMSSECSTGRSVVVDNIEYQELREEVESIGSILDQEILPCPCPE